MVSVSTNFGYLKTLPGICKLVSLLFVMLSIAIGGHAYENSLYNILYKLNSIIPSNQFPDNIPGLGREKFFLAILGMIFIYSSLSLFCCVLNGQYAYDRIVKLSDVAFHVIGAILLITAGSLIIVSARKINNEVCNYNPIRPTTTTGTTTTTTTTTALPSVGPTTQSPNPISTSESSYPTDSSSTSESEFTSSSPMSESTDSSSTSEFTSSSDYSTDPSTPTTEGGEGSPDNNEDEGPDKEILLNFKNRNSFQTERCQFKGEKNAAGSFAILGSFLYGFIAVVQYLRLNNSS